MKVDPGSALDHWNVQSSISPSFAHAQDVALMTMRNPCKICLWPLKDGRWIVTAAFAMVH